MAGQQGQVIAITRQEGDRVILSVPMAGFPEGFQLRPGDQVVLVQGDDGPAVRPLARARQVGSLPEEKEDVIMAADQELVTQAATVRAEGPDERQVVFTVPNESGEPEEVLSIRRPQ